MTKNLDERLSFLQAELGYETTFDLVIRRLKVAHRQAALVFFDGFVNDQATIHIMRSLQSTANLGCTQGALEQLLR
ncbi:MAG: spore germination protein, partial [Firmicutes bacterium]|nr:spore germination protein [Bacillota bacterium]